MSAGGNVAASATAAAVVAAAATATDAVVPDTDTRTVRQKYTQGLTFGVPYKTAELMVIDKPPDVRIDGDFELTAETWVHAAHPELVAGEGHKMRLCHQLDHATSGLLVLGFRKVMAARVTHCFQNRIAKKLYLALVHGHPDKDVPHRFQSPIAEDPSDETHFRMCVGRLPPKAAAGDGLASPVAKKRKGADGAEEGLAEADDGADADALPVGRAALTYARVLQHGYLVAGDAGQPERQRLPVSLVVLAPCTGRRHQLRVHCARTWGHPIVGDICYCEADRGRSIPRMMLHAWKLHLPMDTTPTDGADNRELARSKAARRAASRKKSRAERDDADAANDAERDAQMAFLNRVVGTPGAGLDDASGYTEESGAWIEFTAANRLREFFEVAQGGGGQ